MSAEDLAVARRFIDTLASAAKAGRGESEIEELTELGGGRVATECREIYRTKQTGEFAYARDRKVVLTIRDGKIASYEMRFAG